MKRINELFNVEEDFKIYSIHSDSRYVKKNSIFFCIDGLSVDGHRYIEDALFLGAKVIVYSKPLTYKKQGILYIKVNDVLDELNRVADLFYDSPSRKMNVIGVTGSSGKTSVCMILKDILSQVDDIGFIGTNNIEYNHVREQCPYTTPESIFLQKHLCHMVTHDIKTSILEVSSHGLALKRVNSVHFDIGVFTNVFDEHMDFHGTIEHVMMTKSKLFTMIDESGYAVLNADEYKFINKVRSDIHCNVITYGIDYRADVMAKNIELFYDHSEFDLFIYDHNFHVSIPLIGKVNVQNVLAVSATLLALKYQPIEIYSLLAYIRNINGRYERIAHTYPFEVIIDYCKSIRAFEEIFKFARAVKKGNGRIISVLGPMGKKMSKKRSSLGKLLDYYCDQVILSETDNKDDDLIESCLDLQNYIHNAVSVVITDRRIAIEQAIEIAGKDDIILLLGKGDETFMNTIIGQVPYQGDKAIAMNAIQRTFRFENDDKYI